MSTKIALFKAGELSQVDAPMDLYMNPIDLEAADFIGNPRINFLEGTARYENGKLMVKCELSDYTFDKADMTDESIPNGEFPVVVAIRPEQVRRWKPRLMGPLDKPGTLGAVDVDLVGIDMDVHRLVDVVLGQGVHSQRRVPRGGGHPP